MNYKSVYDSMFHDIFSDYIEPIQKKPSIRLNKIYSEYKFDNGGEMTYLISLPYIKKEDILCSVNSGILTIKTDGKLTKEDNPFVIYGKHDIAVNKPASMISTSFKDNILHVMVKKDQKLEDTEIPIG